MKSLKVFLSCALVVLLASCGSKKVAVAEGDNEPLSPSGFTLSNAVKKVNENRQTEQFLTSRMNLNVTSGHKKISVGGNLRMKRDDVIQLSLVAFGVVEAGRMELTKTHFMLVDRIGHQYVKCRYSDVSFFKSVGIDFYTFQSLFWDELFVLGNNGMTPTDEQFRKTLKGEDVVLTNTDNKRVALTFVANVINGLVKQTQFSQGEDQPAVLDWQYLAWGKLGKHEIPSKMSVRFNTGKAPVEATLNLTSIKADSNWETRTDLNESRYKAVELKDVITRMMNLTNGGE